MPADFASHLNCPFRATFHSLPAIPRSDLAPRNWPEIRKGRKPAPYGSRSYARTNQAVGLRHWLPKWANVPSEKPAVLPCVLFDLFKQFLRSEPGSGVLRRIEVVQDLGRHDLRRRLTTDVIVVVRTVFVDGVMCVLGQIRSDQPGEVHPRPASLQVSVVVFLNELEHGIRVPAPCKKQQIAAVPLDSFINSNTALPCSVT